MQVLNLTNVEKSDIKYTISHFPDGEVQITLEEFSRKDDIEVLCRITSAEELFLLMQVNDILTRQGVEWSLEIYYLMGMRMDRVMDFNRPFTLSIIADIIKSFSCDRVSVLEAHSNRTLSLLGCSEMGSAIPKELTIGCPEFSEKYTLVLPDEGAHKRLFKFLKRFNISAIVCKKKRDVATGHLTGFEITNPEDVLKASKPLMIVDDLCDGGGTFCGIAAEIRKVRPDAKLNIFVIHMVNPKGVENLSKNFDHVWFTNSYNDWKKAWEHQPTPFPANITQIEVI